MKMKNLIFCVAMNFISAIVLIGAGAMEMNNLVTSVPAIGQYHRASEGADYLAGAAAPSVHSETAEGGAGAV